MKFDEIGLSATLLQAVSEAGYDRPTLIQASSIPVILQGEDMIGIAQTGTGKTAAFTLPMIDLLARGRARARIARALILSPTRELAMQTAENFKIYGKHHRVRSVLLIGGVSLEKQVLELNSSADVLIATPGRLLDHVERGRLLLSGIEIMVIDEADRMLDMGFIPDIERIIKLLPRRRQTLLFSATIPEPVKQLAEQFMRSPHHIEASPSGQTVEKIKQLLVWTDEGHKMYLLMRYLRAREGNVLIFCNRRRDVDRVSRTLSQSDFQVEALHGDMSQFQRIKVLEQFRLRTLPILVASDVAARGLDIADIARVVNFDVPRNAEDYVHRIGRTGRAGKSGDALTLATQEEIDFVEAIETLIGISIPKKTLQEIKAYKRATPPARSPNQPKARKQRSARRQDSADPVSKEMASKNKDNHAHLGEHPLPAFLRNPR